jgi:hypothetical protein
MSWGFPLLLGVGLAAPTPAGDVEPAEGRDVMAREIARG